MQGKSVREVKEALAALGPVLPGSISRQWNVCGKAGCRCKSSCRPQKHGPYYQLSFTVGGRSSTLFLKARDVAAAQQCIRRYRRFRDLNARLVAAYVALARRKGVARLGEAQ